MVAIVDYDMGNLASIGKALKILNINYLITNDHAQIEASKAIILPGVGSFAQGMSNLRKKRLDFLLTKEVIEKQKPFLGICLGMQLIMDNGTEPFPSKGLGWIKGNVERIQNKFLPVPHIGWNNVYSDLDKKKIDDLGNNYYFIHSYHIVPTETVEKTWVDYEYPMVASIRKKNIYATQFHPEKSQSAGLKLLKEFFQDYA